MPALNTAYRGAPLNGDPARNFLGHWRSVGDGPNPQQELLALAQGYQRRAAHMNHSAGNHPRKVPPVGPLGRLPTYDGSRGV